MSKKKHKHPNVYKPNLKSTSSVKETVDEVKENITNEEQKEDAPVQTETYVTAGDMDCYVYFDVQFTGLRKNSSIISIGLVDAAQRTFYAELTDYNKRQCDNWIKNNVLSVLINPENSFNNETGEYRMTGTKEEVSEKLWDWLNLREEQNGGKLVQFVGDVAQYGFVLLMDLLLNDIKKTTLNLPTWMSPALHDLNQELAGLLYRNKPVNVSKEEFDSNHVPTSQAFSLNRVEIANSIGVKCDDKTYHQALIQALIIKAIHYYIWNLTA